ncbi:MAG: hypothetical protein ACKVVT_11135 [Dehalococcoidia bacterium]
MTRIPLEEAPSCLADLFERAVRGEEIVIEGPSAKVTLAAAPVAPAASGALAAPGLLDQPWFRDAVQIHGRRLTDDESEDFARRQRAHPPVVNGGFRGFGRAEGLVDLPPGWDEPLSDEEIDEWFHGDLDVAQQADRAPSGP